MMVVGLVEWKAAWRAVLWEAHLAALKVVATVALTVADSAA